MIQTLFFRNELIGFTFMAEKNALGPLNINIEALKNSKFKFPFCRKAIKLE